jgi:hypothetical protein
MANPIVQRLIAAGASPARANAFATQFTASQPNVKTQDLEDAFDDQLAELSKVYFPNAFRPPAIDDPRFNDYVEFLSPGALSKIENSVYVKNAPEFNKAKKATNYAKEIAEYIEAGASLAEINTLIERDEKAGVLTKSTFTVIDPMKTAKQAASDYASSLITEYEKVAPALVAAKTNFIKTDKIFAAGLPSPKLKYGEKEDLKQGIISWKTSLKGEKALKDPKVSQAKAVAQTAPSSYMVDPKNPKASITAFDKLRGDATNVEKDLFKQFMTQKKIPTPLKDEISRREYLKDKTTR